MTTLETILLLLYRIDLNTQIAIGMAFRLNAGYQSKECKDIYTKSEQYALQDFKELQSYPPNWVDAARIIKDIRRRK